MGSLVSLKRSQSRGNWGLQPRRRLFVQGRVLTGRNTQNAPGPSRRKSHRPSTPRPRDRTVGASTLRNRYASSLPTLRARSPHASGRSSPTPATGPAPWSRRPRQPKKTRHPPIPSRQTRNPSVPPPRRHLRPGQERFLGRDGPLPVAALAAGRLAWSRPRMRPKGRLVPRRPRNPPRPPSRPFPRTR